MINRPIDIDDCMLYLKAVSHLECKEYDKVIACINSATIKLNAAHYHCRAEAYKNKAFQIHKQGRTNQNDINEFSRLCELACMDFIKTIELHPQHSAAYSSLGQISFVLCKYDEAIEYFTHAINSAEQDKSIAYLNRAFVFCTMRRYDMAVKDMHHMKTSDCQSLIERLKITVPNLDIDTIENNQNNLYLTRALVFCAIDQYGMAIEDLHLMEEKERLTLLEILKIAKPNLDIETIEQNHNNLYLARALMFCAIGQYGIAIQDLHRMEIKDRKCLMDTLRKAVPSLDVQAIFNSVKLFDELDSESKQLISTDLAVKVWLTQVWRQFVHKKDIDGHELTFFAKDKNGKSLRKPLPDLPHEIWNNISSYIVNNNNPLKLQAAASYALFRNVVQVPKKETLKSIIAKKIVSSFFMPVNSESEQRMIEETERFKTRINLP